MSLIGNPAADDRAIIVGIRDYPDQSFPPLRGPVNDAIQFYEWVTADDGGRLPKERATLIVSDYEGPEETRPEVLGKPVPKEASGAEPAWKRIDTAFRELRKECRGRRIGRRLYFYFSGHGLSIRRGHCGLYCADATRVENTYFPCTTQVDWLIDAGAFAEILMFADCCRNRRPTGSDLWSVQPIGGDPRKVQAVFLMAAQDGLSAKEKRLQGKTHGVFTWALLNALKGGAADERGRITVQKLVTYVATAMPDLLSAEEREDPEVSTYPEPVFHPPLPLPDFEIATARRKPDGWIESARLFVSPRPHPFETKIKTGPFAGAHLEIRGPESGTVADSTLYAPEIWTVNLEAGLYMIRNRSTDTKFPFEVPNPAGAEFAFEVHTPEVSLVGH